MTHGINNEIKKRIDEFEEGAIFTTSDFLDITNNTTCRKCLGRLAGEKKIRRVINGVYEKPIYSELLKEYVPTDPNSVAYAIAKKYHWTISPSGDIALNKLGISTQVPSVWSYISDGPYREFSWDRVTISFKHRTNRDISYMSESTILVVEALNTLGNNHINENVIATLKERLLQEEKEKLLYEATNTSEWIYKTIRKVCEN